MPDAIRIESLEKRFGETVALDGASLAVEEGELVALLGPNGAGKTTAVRILATLLAPDSGLAEVFGHDVVGDPRGARRHIGLTGQYAAVDELLTGAENLEMIGQLFRLSRAKARQAAREALERMDLVDAADRRVQTYSGGMRRRLDLAASLIGRPRIVFLDEPTTGLDPRSRKVMWDLIEELVDSGMTVLLTTQYLEEADRLAQRIAILEEGKVIADAPAATLKRQVGGARLELTIEDPEGTEQAVEVLRRHASAEPVVERPNALSAPLGDRQPDTVRLMADLVEHSLGIVDLGVRSPTLDDVFLTLTGHRVAEGQGVETAVEATPAEHTTEEVTG